MGLDRLSIPGSRAAKKGVYDPEPGTHRMSPGVGWQRPGVVRMLCQGLTVTIWGHRQRLGEAALGTLCRSMPTLGQAHLKPGPPGQAVFSWFCLSSCLPSCLSARPLSSPSCTPACMSFLRARRSPSCGRAPQETFIEPALRRRAPLGNGKEAKVHGPFQGQWRRGRGALCLLLSHAPTCPGLLFCVHVFSPLPPALSCSPFFPPACPSIGPSASPRTPTMPSPLLQPPYAHPPIRAGALASLPGHKHGSPGTWEWGAQGCPPSLESEAATRESNQRSSLTVHQHPAHKAQFMGRG